MKHVCRKALSVILVIAVLFSFAALTVSAENFTAVPTVYLYGYGSVLYEDKTDSSSKVIFPVAVPDNFASEVVDKVKGPISKGVLLNDWDEFHQVVVDTVCDIYSGFALDENGEVTDQSGNIYANYSYPLDDRKNASGYELNTYNYSYDWRIDPFEVADGLHEYIEEVCKATGYDKVNLIGRCLGGNIILAYLKVYGYSQVDQICFYAPGFQGFECIGALFSGDIVFDVDALPDYFDQAGRAQLSSGDNPTYDLLVTALEFLNAAKTLNVAKPVFNHYLIPEFRQYILPEIMRRTFGTLPSFWSFIGDEYYDQAMQVIFGGYEETYAGIIEKANRYHNEVMAHTGDLINDSVANGVETYIVAKYGSRMVPIVKNADVQSDSTVTTANSSHGAATAPLYGSFSDDFVKGIQTANGGKYLSADHQIDASSCLLPDHTWLIKNLFHHENPDQVEKMIAAFFDYDGYMSVFDQEVYPQYLNYDRDTDSISPLSSDASASKAPKYSFFKSLIALIKLIITVLKNSR